LVTFLRNAEELCRSRQISIDRGTLPDGIRRLLDLAAAVPERQEARRGAAQDPILAHIGKWSIGVVEAAAEMLGFIGEAFLAFLQVLRGRAGFRSFVLYFDGSLKGGQHRRARRFSGVRVGLVIDIKVQYLAKTNEFRTPVYIQIEASRIGQADIKGSREERKHYLQSLIDRGLRARLEVQSVVTGQLIVQLGF
jgi:hypothetical protein